MLGSNKGYTFMGEAGLFYKSMNITSSRGGLAVAETETARPHFDGGTFRGKLDEVCLVTLTKQDLLNVIDDDIRMSCELEGNSATLTLRLWQMRCYAMLKKIVREADIETES